MWVPINQLAIHHHLPSLLQYGNTPFICTYRHAINKNSDVQYPLLKYENSLSIWFRSNRNTYEETYQDVDKTNMFLSLKYIRNYDIR